MKTLVGTTTLNIMQGLISNSKVLAIRYLEVGKADDNKIMELITDYLRDNGILLNALSLKDQLFLVHTVSQARTYLADRQ